MMNTSRSHQTISESRKVDTILQTLYPSVKNLHGWLENLDKSGTLKSTLLTDEDHEGYKHLLRTTLVAEKTNKEYETHFTFSQASHQQEIVVRGVQRVLRRDGVGNNVLALGFGPMTDNPKASVTTVSSIEYRYPNSSVSRLQFRVWKILLTRIGDSLMSHLLENTSIFILLAKPAVYLQVTGEPIFQQWPFATGSTYPAKLHSCSGQKQHNNSKFRHGSKSATKQGRKTKQKEKCCSGETTQAESQPPSNVFAKCARTTASGCRSMAGEEQQTRHTSQSTDQQTRHMSQSTDQQTRHTSQSTDQQTRHTSQSTDQQTRHMSQSQGQEERRMSQSDDREKQHESQSTEREGQKRHSQKSTAREERQQRQEGQSIRKEEQEERYKSPSTEREERGKKHRSRSTERETDQKRHSSQSTERKEQKRHSQNSPAREGRQQRQEGQSIRKEEQEERCKSPSTEREERGKKHRSRSTDRDVEQKMHSSQSAERKIKHKRHNSQSTERESDQKMHSSQSAERKAKQKRRNSQSTEREAHNSQSAERKAKQKRRNSQSTERESKQKMHSSQSAERKAKQKRRNSQSTERESEQKMHSSQSAERKAKSAERKIKQKRRNSQSTERESEQKMHSSQNAERKAKQKRRNSQSTEREAEQKMHSSQSAERKAKQKRCNSQSTEREEKKHGSRSTEGEADQKMDSSQSAERKIKQKRCNSQSTERDTDQKMHSSQSAERKAKQKRCNSQSTEREEKKHRSQSAERKIKHKRRNSQSTERGEKKHGSQSTERKANQKMHNSQSAERKIKQKRRNSQSIEREEQGKKHTSGSTEREADQKMHSSQSAERKAKQKRRNSQSTKREADQKMHNSQSAERKAKQKRCNSQSTEREEQEQKQRSRSTEGQTKQKKRKSKNTQREAKQKRCNSQSTAIETKQKRCNSQSTAIETEQKRCDSQSTAIETEQKRCNSQSTAIETKQKRCNSQSTAIETEQKRCNSQSTAIETKQKRRNSRSTGEEAEQKRCNSQGTGEQQRRRSKSQITEREGRKEGTERENDSRHMSQSIDREDLHKSRSKETEKVKQHESRSTEREDQLTRRKRRSKDGEEPKWHISQNVETEEAKSRRSQRIDKWELLHKCNSQMSEEEHRLLIRKRKSLQDSSEPNPKRRKLCDSEVNATHLSQRLQRNSVSQGEIVSLTQTPAIKGKRRCAATSISIPVTAHTLSGKEHVSVADKCQQSLQQGVISSSCPPHLSPVVSNVTVVTGTSDSSAGITGTQFSQSNCIIKRDDAKESSSKSKRQRKRKREKKKKKQLKACSPGARPYQHHRYFPRLSLLYGRSLREKFPSSFTLAAYKPSGEGAKLLFTDIFVKNDVGGNLNGDERPCQCQQEEDAENTTVISGSIKGSACSGTFMSPSQLPGHALVNQSAYKSGEIERHPFRDVLSGLHFDEKEQLSQCQTACNSEVAGTASAVVSNAECQRTEDLSLNLYAGHSSLAKSSGTATALVCDDAGHTFLSQPSVHSPAVSGHAADVARPSTQCLVGQSLLDQPAHISHPAGVHTAQDAMVNRNLHALNHPARDKPVQGSVTAKTRTVHQGVESIPLDSTASNSENHYTAGVASRSTHWQASEHPSRDCLTQNSAVANTDTASFKATFSSHGKVGAKHVSTCLAAQSLKVGEKLCTSSTTGTPNMHCQELDQPINNLPVAGSSTATNTVAKTPSQGGTQNLDAADIYNTAAATLSSRCIHTADRHSEGHPENICAVANCGATNKAVSTKPSQVSEYFSAESTVIVSSNVAAEATPGTPTCVCSRSQLLQLLQSQQAMHERALRQGDKLFHVEGSSNVEMTSENEHVTTHCTTHHSMLTTQNRSTSSRVHICRGAADTTSPEGPEEQVHTRYSVRKVTRDSGEIRTELQSMSHDGDISSSGDSSILPCGQKCDNSNSQTLTVSLPASTKECGRKASVLQENAHREVPTACGSSVYQSLFMKDINPKTPVPDSSAFDHNPCHEVHDVSVTAVHQSSERTGGRERRAGSTQDQFLQEISLNAEPTSQSMEVSSSSNIFQLVSSLSTTPDSTVSFKSPMDIIIAETPSWFKSGSDSESSTSVSISNYSSPAGSVAQSGNHEHSSFYGDGSSRNKSLVYINMTDLQESKELSKQKDGPGCANLTSSLAERGVTKQAEEKGEGAEMQVGDKETTASVVPALPEFHPQVVPILQQLLHNHRKCRHWALLEHHCKSRFDKDVKKAAKTTNHTAARRRVDKGDNAAAGGGNTRANQGFRRKIKKKPPATPKLLEDHIPQGKVLGFLQAVVKQTVPEKLLGSSANMAHLLKNLKSLVSAGKFEKMCLGQLVTGLKVKSCVWLRKVLCPREKQHRLAQLMWWIIICFVFPLIRAFFYLTDTSALRTRVLYYRKKTWLRLQMRAMNDFRKATTCKLQGISQTKVNQLLASGQCLGVSALRFLPKSQSLRPIVNMSCKQDPNAPLHRMQKRSITINRQLMKLFDVLKYEMVSENKVPGCSVFGIEDAYMKLKQFKENRASRHDDRCLYFVKTDVSKCFDSIHQQLLFSIVRDIFTKDGEQTYNTRKYASVRLMGQNVKRVFHTDTKRLTHFEPDFTSFARQQSKDGKFTDIVLVDQALCMQETTASLLNVLSSHLFRNIIKVGQRHYLQGQGISQGSVVSTLLANLYLSHLEATHLTVLSDELLIRWMDDYLFVTPDRSHAQHFVETMGKGFPDYNCFCNAEKMMTSFPVQLPSLASTKHTQPGDPLPWCGLLINTSSLEVSVDYSRYSGLCITDPATFDTSNKPGQTLRSKLVRCMKIRCHAIYFDPVINSRERMLVNAHQLMLFVATIFHSFVLKLPANRRVDANPGFFISTVNMIPRYMLTLVARQFKQGKPGYGFLLQLAVLQWLNADAFLTKLHRYPGYKPLKRYLTAKKQSLQRKMKAGDLQSLKAVCRSGKKVNADILLCS